MFLKGGLNICFEVIYFIYSEMFSYKEVQEEVLSLLITSIEFAKTQDFISYIKDEGLNMHSAIEQLTTRTKDLMKECAVVIAGKHVYVE